MKLWRLEVKLNKKFGEKFCSITKIVYLWLRRRYSRSRKLKYYLVFFSLIRTFASEISICITHEDEERESKTSDTVAGGSLPREDP
jgi:hypothetical protein